MYTLAPSLHTMPSIISLRRNRWRTRRTRVRHVIGIGSLAARMVDGDAADFFTSSCEDGVVLGGRFGLLLGVFAGEVFVERVVEGAAEGFAYALW